MKQEIVRIAPQARINIRQLRRSYEIMLNRHSCFWSWKKAPFRRTR